MHSVDDKNVTAGVSDPMAEAQLKLADGPPVGSVWQHFKGGTYRVTGNVVLEEDLDHIVCYVGVHSGSECGRRLSVWNGYDIRTGKKRFVQIA